jgi:hypothetical protein
MILGIEDKWIALACLLPSLLMVLASSFTRKPDKAHLGFCFSFNKKNNEEKI